MTRSDHPSQTHLSSSIFCLLGGGVESVESGSSFSELMKLFGLHPSPLLRIFFWRVANKSSPLPKQHLSHFYIFFYGIFLGGGKVRLGGDELIKLEKILYNSPYLHTCPQPSSTFLLKVGGFNLKCRLTDQIPTLTLRNSPPPSNFRGDGTFLCYSIAPTWGPLLPSQRSIYIQC